MAMHCATGTKRYLTYCARISFKTLPTVQFQAFPLCGRWKQNAKPFSSPSLSLRANLIKSLNVSGCLHNISKSFADKGRFPGPQDGINTGHLH